MNQTGFLGSWRWGASHTMGAERKMLKDNLKRLLNHPGLQIFTSHLHMWYSWRMLPATEGDTDRGCGGAGDALGCCQNNDGGNKAPGWDPSPRPPGVGASLNYPYMGAQMSTKGLSTKGLLIAPHDDSTCFIQQKDQREADTRECGRSLAALRRAALRHTGLEEQPNNIPGRPRLPWKRASSAAPFHSSPTWSAKDASWGVAQHLGHTEAKGNFTARPFAKLGGCVSTARSSPPKHKQLFQTTSFIRSHQK